MLSEMIDVLKCFINAQLENMSWVVGLISFVNFLASCVCVCVATEQ